MVISVCILWKKSFRFNAFMLRIINKGILISHLQKQNKHTHTKKQTNKQTKKRVI